MNAPGSNGLSRQPLAGSWSELAALTPAWVALAWLVSKAQWFWNHQADLQFGWVVLLLCGYLLWEAWETRPLPRWRWRPTFVVMIGAALPLFFLVQIFQAACGTNAASVAGLALAVMGVTLGQLGYVYGGPGLRHFGFAFLFLLIAMPMPSVIHNLVVGGLQSKITSMNVELLNLAGIPARQVGSLIRLPSCTVGVDEACSGIRSLQSTLMATLFIGHLTLARFGLKALLVAAGVMLAVFGNLVRSLYLSFTANARGVAALESVHDTAGWSILLFTAAGVAVLAYLLCKIEAHSRRLAGVRSH